MQIGHKEARAWDSSHYQQLWQCVGETKDCGGTLKLRDPLEHNLTTRGKRHNRCDIRKTPAAGLYTYD